MDWIGAKYETEVKVRTGQATVTHRLSNAHALERLIGDGSAAWAAEIRCPKTLVAKTETSMAASQVLEWDVDDMDGDVFIMPGLLATSDCRLTTPGLSSVYEGIDELMVPHGYWLAKGDTWRASTLMESLLTFHLLKDVKKKGLMEVKPDYGGGQLRFIVEMTADVFEHRGNRTVRIAALVGACAQFPREFRCAVSTGGDLEDEPPLAQTLRDHLEHMRPGLPLWDDPDNYDAALVATLLEPFRLHPMIEGDDRGE